MKTRIAFISDHASPLATLGEVDSGGQNVYVAEVAYSLANMGYMVDIFTRRESGDIAEIVDFQENVRVIHIGAGPDHPIPKEELFVYMETFSAHVIRFIEAEQVKYELVHAHFWLSGMVAMDIKMKLGIPFVITFHALGAVRRFHQGTADKFPQQREKIEQEIIRQAEKVIAECPNDMKDLLAYYQTPQDKIEIIPCGYNPKDFYPIEKAHALQVLGLCPEYRYILQLGRIVPRKGIDNVIEGFALLHEEHNDLRLLVVGGNLADLHRDSEMKRLHQLCMDYAIQDKVIFVGHQGRETLKYFYSASDIFITTPWYEPFGITPLEAMACGTPVIGAEVGGIPFTVRHYDTGLLVPPHHPNRVANSIKLLLADKQKLKSMSRKAIKHVQSNFTWQKVSEQIHRLYVQVLQSNRNKKNLQELAQYFRQASDTFMKSANILPKHIINVGDQMCQVLQSGGKIMICGNGGSAAESQHFVAELVGRFEIAERPGYPVISLNSDTAVLTAWANDFGYDYVFQRQVQSIGQPGDMLICLSTSGNSPNILHALQQANEQGITTVNILGKKGGKALQYADMNIVVPSLDTARIQEVHLHIIHQLCGLVENQMVRDMPQKQVSKLSKLIA